MQSAIVHAQPDFCNSCASRNARSFCSLGDELLREFRTVVGLSRFGAGAMIYREGDRCERVYVVCEGRAKLLSTSGDGKVLLLRFCEPGDVLAVNAAVRGGVHESSAMVTEPSLIGAVSRENMIRFASSHQEVFLRLVELASEEYKAAQRMIRFFAFGATAGARLARLLLDWCDLRGVPADDGIHIRVRVTHTDLAQLVGTTRETVTRLVSELARERVVARSLEEIVVLDRRRLESRLTY